MYWFLILFLLVVFILTLPKEHFSPPAKPPAKPLAKPVLGGSVVAPVASAKPSTTNAHPVLGPPEGSLSTDKATDPTTTNPTTATLFDPYSAMVPGSKKSPQKSPKQTPKTFGPDAISPEDKKRDKPRRPGQHEDEPEQEQSEQLEKPLMDEGTHSSDTATKSHSIYFYQPFASLPFPESSGAPQPFLNDFMPFQR